MSFLAQMYPNLAAMGWLKTPIMILFVLSGLVLILVVLLQATKGSGLAGAFGMGGDTTVLGTRAGTFLGKVTAVLAAVFLLLALVYALIGSRNQAPSPGNTSTQGEENG